MGLGFFIPLFFTISLTTGSSLNTILLVCVLGLGSRPSSLLCLCLSLGSYPSFCGSAQIRMHRIPPYRSGLHSFCELLELGSHGFLDILTQVSNGHLQCVQRRTFHLNHLQSSFHSSLPFSTNGALISMAPVPVYTEE